MPTVEEHKRLVKAIDERLQESLDRETGWAITTASAQELLEQADMPNTENNWRYVIHVIKTYYPDSKWQRGSRSQGFLITVKTRSKR